MAISWLERFSSAWNVFTKPSYLESRKDYGPSLWSTNRSSYVSAFINEGSIVTKIYNQIVIDCSNVSIRHVILGQNGRYEDDYKSYLNRCLTERANIDQSPMAFIRDLVWTMIDSGVAVVVPVDTTQSIRRSEGFDVKSLRVGVVRQWFPAHVEVELYNDRTGLRENVIVPKNNVAVIQNPLYDVMNRPNGDLKRLIEKLRVLDAIDNQASNGKLDLIIQLPYEVRTDIQDSRAKARVESIQRQLKDSKYGIAYAGATERITQLNRPVASNLMDQVEYLTKEVYSSLGLTPAVFDGTATEQVLLNYYTRTINPILDEIVSCLSWAFLSQTARTQGQAIRWFRSPFSMVPTSKFSEIAVQLSQAEIATSNEIRSILGWKPAKDEGADQLRNANINPVVDTASQPIEDVGVVETEPVS